MYSSEYHCVFRKLSQVDSIDCNETNEFFFACRRDKLWIAMELCGGGSMQDIYHGSFEKQSFSF